MTTINLADLQDGKPMQTEVDGKPVCVVKVGADVFAVSNICTHSYAELSDGEVKDYAIECWLHGAEFDLRSGAVLSMPATEPLETFKVINDGETVTIQSGLGE